jgi:hypothetical protein
MTDASALGLASCQACVQRLLPLLPTWCCGEPVEAVRQGLVSSRTSCQGHALHTLLLGGPPRLLRTRSTQRQLDGNRRLPPQQRAVVGSSRDLQALAAQQLHFHMHCEMARCCLQCQFTALAQ